MKRQFVNLFSALALALVAASSFGQSVASKANVPFDFVVSGRTLPAGDYLVRTDDRIIAVRNMASGKTTLVPINNVADFQPATDSKLVFHRYRNTYFLRQVWNAGYSGFDLPETRREKEIAADTRVTGGIAVAGMR